MNLRAWMLSASSLVVLSAGCSTAPGVERVLAEVAAPLPGQEWHVGPAVELSKTGPARFVPSLHAAFQPGRAMQLVTFIDGFYRAPANRGYDAVVDRLVQELRAAGFGGDDPRLTVETIEGPAEPGWTPISAKLVLLADGEKPRELHAFDQPEGVDRVMLPVFAPSCDLEGEVALNLDEVKKGMILVTDVSATQVKQRAEFAGAVAVVSASLESFNEDPSGRNRHLDAIQYRELPEGNTLPVFQISRKSLIAIEEAVDRAMVRKRKVSLALSAQVEIEPRPLRTVVATIKGSSLPGEAVAMVSHVQEPGACDNATGVAGLVESARALAGLLRDAKLPWPDRSLVFIWGDEFRQTEAWLGATDLKPVVGISSDMTGQNLDETGAIARLERMPDPGAITTLPPDDHTPWGAGEVEVDELRPNGFAVIARAAMVDVGLLEGSWRCADHPWEGGSDHDIFIRRGIPAVLFWHFTDFTYHTSLDRLGYVDPKEMRRTGVAILASALAVADPEPGDLERYLKSLDIERDVRLGAAIEADSPELEALWGMWCDGARAWLRKLCLGIDEELPGTERKG
jgi:hypothetical protein